jgi:hypothetical protein
MPPKIIGEPQTGVEMVFIKRLEKLGAAENSVPLSPGRERFYFQLRCMACAKKEMVRRV